MNCQLKLNALYEITELWIAGDFVAGWRLLNLTENDCRVLSAVLDEVWKQAQKGKEKPLRDAIERALRS